MIKNAFCLCLKLFSFLYLFFCPDFFGHAGKRLNINANVISKIDDVSYWERNNYASHIPQWNLVSSEKNHTQNAVEKLVLDRLKKKWELRNWACLWINNLKSWGLPKYNKTEMLTTCLSGPSIHLWWTNKVGEGGLEI